MAPSPVAIVDYGMGNLFSVKHACEHVGLPAVITNEARKLQEASAVVLPGVGAFGGAMASLERLGLVTVLRDIAASGLPMMGICLGMQLLMSGSHEFGWHQGLGILEGEAVRLRGGAAAGSSGKVPHVGWNRIRPSARGAWAASPLAGVHDGAFMYFVHSFYVKPSDPSVTIATTRYGEEVFCAALLRGNVFACQFHPERSGTHGLDIYRHYAGLVAQPAGRAGHG